MRKEISSLFKFKTKKTKKRFFWIFLLLIFFIVVNGIFIYSFNPNNYYFYIIKKIIPYPAFIVENKFITVSYYDDKVEESKKIYEVAYRTNFSSGVDGKNNLDTLRVNVKNEIFDRIIMEGLLNSNKLSISNNDVKTEYDNMLQKVGSDKEILNILKYSSGIQDSEIKDRVYQNLLVERVKDNFIYNLKMKVLVIKPEDSGKEEDWNLALQKAQEIYNDIVSGGNSFDKYQKQYGDVNDPIVQNLGRDYYFGEDLPKALQDKFYDFSIGKINGPIKGDGGYYLFNVYEKRGYYKGSYDDFMKEQKKTVKIISFLR